MPAARLAALEQSRNRLLAEVAEIQRRIEDVSGTRTMNTAAAYEPPAVVTKANESVLTAAKDSFGNRFPHTCPSCGSCAYVGATKIECSNVACQHGGRA
jgi:hypothetical protein